MNVSRMSTLFHAFFMFRRGVSTMRIADICSHRDLGENICVQGWIKSIRTMKMRTFLDVGDGSTFHFLQAVIEGDRVPENVSYGASVILSGKLALAPNSKQFEIQTEDIKVIGSCDLNAGYPFVPRTKYLPQEQREFLHLRPRMRTSGSVLRVRSRASHCIHDFFQREKFVNIHTPLLTSNDCEGAGEIFKAVPESQNLIQEMKKENLTDDEAFFDTTAFLTVSGQLHLEAMSRALCNVYQFGPTFRAENNRSRLHLSEFYMVEAEIAFLSRIDDLLEFMERFIKNITVAILETHEEEIAYYRNLLALPKFNFNNILDKPYCIMNYDEACAILDEHEKKFTSPIRETKHLTKEHELFLIEYNENVPVFVINWPEDKKPFYVKISENTSQAAAVDLLFPDVGELCGGSLREDNYELLKKKLAAENLLERLNWYLDLRKFGNVPTGGFGMGFERYLKVILGTNSVKETIPFPRWPHNCKL